MALHLTEGQASDYKGAAVLLNSMPQADELLADRGYDAAWFREKLLEKGIVPDVSGMGLKDALYLLENEGYKVNFSGSGRVVSQTPDAGTALGRGHKITLTLK